MFAHSQAKKSVCVAAVVEIGGLVLLALADSESFDVFIPGMIMIAAGGLMTMLSAFPISFRFPQYQPAILVRNLLYIYIYKYFEAF